MAQPRSNQKVVVTLEEADGAQWRLTLSRDCLRFIGRYPRVEGFDIDPAQLFAAFTRPA